MSQLAGNFFLKIDITCIVYLCMIWLYHGYVSVRTHIQNQGFFFAILGRDPRTFQIGKNSIVNPINREICYSAQLCHFW